MGPMTVVMVKRAPGLYRLGVIVRFFRVGLRPDVIIGSAKQMADALRITELTRHVSREGVETVAVFVLLGSDRRGGWYGLSERQGNDVCISPESVRLVGTAHHNIDNFLRCQNAPTHPMMLPGWDIMARISLSRSKTLLTASRLRWRVDDRACCSTGLLAAEAG